MKLTDEYIFRQPEKHQTILFYLIDVVNQEIPDATFNFKWGIPYFYYKKKPFCYLAPNHKKDFVDLGFAKGFQLQNHQEFLISENRNTVKSLRYHTLKSIEHQVLIDVIQEAITLYK
ncbi:MAG TPA: DUF1801 domain-containing protein [Flavobacterium sp.]|nr:DUF1801 domain-containing protein [Flavobacterium sp.]